MKDPYESKKALVTGGSSGIGFAVAHRLVQSGASVWIAARTPDRLAKALADLEQVRRDPSQTIASLQVDLSDAADTQRVLGELVRQAGAPDYLFNIAGFCQPGYVEEVSLDVYRETIEANYYGTLNPTQTLLPAMLERGSGHIINTSSVMGYVSLFGYAPYAASKYAVRGYSDVLRMEMKPRGIHVSIVFPPDTDTPQLAYENQFKVPETLAVEAVAGQTAAVSADYVAQIILRDTARRKYQIFPGSSNKIMYIFQSLAMGLTYPVMDMLLRQAYRNLARQGNVRPRTQDTH